MTRGRPPGATAEDIVATARRILESDGAEGLSMRRLGAELGVAPPVVYRQVGGREQVIAAVVAQLLDEAAAIVPKGRTPKTRLRSIVLAIREQVRRHPFLVHVAREIGQGPGVVFPGQLALARELSAAGLRGHEAATALRAILYVVGGFIVVEALPPESAELSSTRALWRTVTDPGVDPTLAEEMAGPPDLDAVFTYAVDHLIDAVLAGAQPA